jgi:hypothetical protein
MKTICSFGIIILFSASFAPQLLSAQQQAPVHAPDGGSRERLQSISVLPKAGASFSAVVVTEWTRLLEDGTTTTIKNHRTIARDSTGRIFQERRFFSPTGDKQETPLSNLEYADPTRHEFYDCVPATHVCIVSAYYVPASAPANLPLAVTLPNGAGTITRENLGQKSISDLDAVGSREITTINPGVNGYKVPEPTIKEFWYSPRLEVNLIVKRFEPRGGAQNITVLNIDLSEPDPKLFTPPPGYRIIHTEPSASSGITR